MATYTRTTPLQPKFTRTSMQTGIGKERNEKKGNSTGAVTSRVGVKNC